MFGVALVVLMCCILVVVASESVLCVIYIWLYIGDITKWTQASTCLTLNSQTDTEKTTTNLQRHQQQQQQHMKRRKNETTTQSHGETMNLYPEREPILPTLSFGFINERILPQVPCSIILQVGSRRLRDVQALVSLKTSPSLILVPKALHPWNQEISNAGPD